jgi:pyruvate dehydrogenase E2 component (dihydrolipoamide acetyltransferase)
MATDKIPLTAPDLGDASDVPIIEINIAVGQAFEKEQALLLLETEKATMEVPAPCSGKVLELCVKVGDTLSSGSLILFYAGEEPAEKAPVEKAPVEKAPSSAVEKEAKTAPVEERVCFSHPVHAGPATRRLAREQGIDLRTLTGSGRHGRIVREDLNAGGTVLASAPIIEKGAYTKPLSRIKQLTARNMLRNWSSIPHVTQFDEADLTDCEAFRKKQNALYPAVKLTPLVFIMKAVVQALIAFPEFHARLNAEGTELHYPGCYHVGVAVDTPNGLVVPVFENVDRFGLRALSEQLGIVSAKARAGTLSAKEMQGQSFTISSLGGIGGTAFTPIINAPDVAILGLSKMQWKPVYQDGAFVPRLMLPLSLSYDHRVIDGAEAARFTHYLSQLLSDISTLLL